MHVTEALVSGSLGQAMFFAEGDLLILAEPDGNPRRILPNEVAWFRYKARAVAFANPHGLPVSVDDVRRRLNEEIRLFNGIDGLLVGMDRDFSERVRRRSIARADRLLVSDGELARQIRERFLIPANSQEWDPSGGMQLAIVGEAESAAACYRPLAEGIIDRLADDIASTVFARLGTGINAVRHRELILRSGLLAELALIESRNDREALLALMFRRNDFPKLRASDPSGQILAAVIHRIEKRLVPAKVNSTSISEAIGSEPDEKLNSVDPIIGAVERALTEYERRKNKRQIGSAADVPGIQREIEWIGERLNLGQVPRAEQALLTLVDRQGQRSRPEDIVKTLTAVADLARLSRQYDWTLRVLDALDHLGATDSASRNVRAQTLRATGRGDEALAVLEETMRRFPDDEVARNAYAEVLREAGRSDEALAVLEETMRRFPDDEVARNAYAKALREVGRGDEALAVLEETMRHFPDDEVTRNTYAEVLREAGRGDEALAVLEETMRRFPNDEVARNAYAEALREAGRGDEALAVLEETIRRFPDDEVACTAYAEALREAGRGNEALAVLEETMRRFPHDEVTRNAYAKALREAGRGDEALAVLEETMRRFPDDEVTRNAYAELLREAGRGNDALAVLEETMRRFPHDKVVPNAYAEALREAGRGNEALAILEETMRRFPHNEVTRNAYAEALREAGRGDEALAVLEETMRRFPHDEVARNTYAHMLVEGDRVGEAEALLLPAAKRSQSRGDWIAAHVLAMAWLRNKRIDEALDEFKRGVDHCKFADVKRYFVTARPLALLAARRAEEAVRQLEQIAKDQSLPREDSTNIALFRVHALAEAGQANIAQDIIKSAQIIDFAAAKQKRLAATLEKRYGIISGVPATDSEAERLNKDIANLEFELVRPKLWNFGVRKVG